MSSLNDTNSTNDKNGQKKQCFKLALKTTIPVFLGYISCGIAFGLITINAGYSWRLAPAMGLLMFAGAGQFLAGRRVQLSVGAGFCAAVPAAVCAPV